jgi:hypothetical protein
MTDREDFPKWIVEKVYEIQEGACANCGASLESGFHRHHKDGNPSNNSIENLVLLCPRCHRATFGEKYKMYKEQELRVLNSLNQLIDEIFSGKMSGVLAERAQSALGMSLRLAKEYYDVDDKPEPPPASITLMKRLSESASLTEAFQEGFIEGFKRGVEFALQVRGS